MKVARGTDGKGTPAMQCVACHQDSNVTTPHAPPGVSGWRMPGAESPMAWVGLPASKLCRVLKDPATNGNRSLADLVEHVRTDKIVNWAWAPGPGRTLPPISHTAFVDAVKAWIDAGAPCPE